VSLSSSTLEDDENDQCRHKQNGYLYTWSHEHSTTAVFRVPSSAALGGLVSSRHMDLSK